jgi:hypothetical protein
MDEHDVEMLIDLESELRRDAIEHLQFVLETFPPGSAAITDALLAAALLSSP